MSTIEIILAVATSLSSTMAIVALCTARKHRPNASAVGKALLASPSEIVFQNSTAVADDKKQRQHLASVVELERENERLKALVAEGDVSLRLEILDKEIRRLSANVNEAPRQYPKMLLALLQKEKTILERRK